MRGRRDRFRRGSRGRLGSGCRRGGSGSTVTGPNQAEHFTDRDDVTFPPVDAGQDAILLRGHVEIDFVSLELDQAVAPGDRVALLLQPGANDRVDQRLA